MYIGTLEVFSLFDKDEDGVVKVSDIGPMLRSIGFNPSEVEIQQLQEEQDTENGIERHTVVVSSTAKVYEYDVGHTNCYGYYDELLSST